MTHGVHCLPDRRSPDRDHVVLRRRAFTLIEILVVIAIIAIMVALMVGVTKEVIKQAYIKETEAKLVVLRDLINRYHRELGNYPNVASNEDLVAQLNRLDKISVESLVGRDFYDGGAVVDSWKNKVKYIYSASGTVADPYNDMFLQNNRTPLLVSAGPDGAWNVKDDVFNPPRR